MKLVALCGLLLAGCTGPGAPVTPPPTTSAAPSAQAAPATPASPAARVIDVACSEAIANRATPDTPVAVLGVIALPTGTIVAATHSPRPGWLGAKRGLGIRADAAVEVLVAPAAAGRARIGWGSSWPMGTHVRAVPCAHTTGWLFYPGGYEVNGPMCVPLIVRSAGREARVDIGVGAGCPGPA